MCKDGVEFVCERLDSGERPDMIVPALPVHLAYEYVRRRMDGMDGRRLLRPLPMSETGMDRLPNPVSGADGEVYVSHAEFVCPDTCAEPADRCTVTGRPRRQDMFELLGALTGDFTPVVLRSRQLAPGVGGYTPEALIEAANRVERLSGIVLLATACRCHGVVHAFQIV